MHATGICPMNLFSLAKIQASERANCCKEEDSEENCTASLPLHQHFPHARKKKRSRKRQLAMQRDHRDAAARKGTGSDAKSASLTSSALRRPAVCSEARRANFSKTASGKWEGRRRKTRLSRFGSRHGGNELVEAGGADGNENGLHGRRRDGATIERVAARTAPGAATLPGRKIAEGGRLKIRNAWTRDVIEI